MKRVRILCFCMVFILLCPLSGCWNYREIDRLSLVTGFTVDKSVNGGYLVTAEIIGYDTEGTGAKAVSEIIESQGETIFDAIRNIITLSGRKLYWAHAKIVIVSSQVAKEGITKVLDFIVRDAEIRPDIYLLISTGNSAKELFSQESITNIIRSFEIRDMLESEKFLSKSLAVEAYRYANDVSTENSTIILPTVGIVEHRGMRTSKMIGTAVVKNDKLAGFISSEDSKYLLFALDEVKGGLLIIDENAGSSSDKITLEISDSKTNVKPLYSDEKLRMVMNVKTTVSIGEVHTKTNYMDKGVYEKLKRNSEKFLKENIERVIKDAQQKYEADVAGYGRYIYADMPSVWKKLSKSWDEELKNIETDVNVEIDIRNSARLSKPIKAGE